MLVKLFQIVTFFEKLLEFLNVSLLVGICKMVGVVQPIPQISDVVVYKVSVV